MSQQYYQPTGTQTGQTSQQYGQQSGQTQRYTPASREIGQGMGQQPVGQQTGQQPVGQQMGQQAGGAMGQQVGGQFHASLPNEFRTAIEEFAKVTQIAEWCADKCIDEGPRMAKCARACEDLADLAEINEKLIARDSVFGPQVAEAYLEVVELATPILQQFQQSPHVGETLSAVTRSKDSINQLLQSIGYQPRSVRGGGMQTGGFGQQTGGFGQQTGGFGQGTQVGGGQRFGVGTGQQGPTGQGSFQQSSY